MARNGEIVLGVKISFFDENAYSYDPLCDSQVPYKIQLTTFQHDGWLVFHPKAGEFWLFFNRKWADKEFELLGEL